MPLSVPLADNGNQRVRLECRENGERWRTVCVRGSRSAAWRSWPRDGGRPIALRRRLSPGLPLSMRDEKVRGEDVLLCYPRSKGAEFSFLQQWFTAWKSEEAVDSCRGERRR